MIQFINTINAALSAPNPENRKAAEAQLFNYLELSTLQFFDTLVLILKDQAQHTLPRKSAGVVLRRMVSKSNSSGQLYWTTIPLDKRAQIKENLLLTLATNDREVRRQASDVIHLQVHLHRLLYRGQDRHLAHSHHHPRQQCQRASLLTLQYICQQLKNQTVKLSDSTQQSILSCILLGLKDTDDKQLRQSSMKALQESVGIMHSVFQNPSYSKFVLGLIAQNLALPNQNLKQSCLNAISQFCTYYYDQLQPYIDIFAKLTVPIIQNYAEPVNCKYASEIWKSIACQYKKKLENKQSANNFLQPIMGQLIQLFLQNLIITNSYQEDDELNSISSSAETVLSALAPITNYAGIQIIINFISNTIQNQDWKVRRASCVAFSTIVESKLPQIPRLIDSAITEFTNKINDPHFGVKIEAAKAIQRIAQTCPQSILNNSNFKQNLIVLLGGVCNNVQLVRSVSWTLCYLGEQVQRHQNVVMRQHTRDIINTLYGNVLKEEDTNNREIIDVCIMAIFNIIHYSNDEDVAKQYINHFVNQLNKVVTTPKSNKQEAMMTGLLTLLHACMMVLQKRTSTVDYKWVMPKQEKQQLIQVYKFIIDLFKHLKDVLADGLFVIGSIASLLKKDFIPFFEEFWVYIEYALKDNKDPQKIKASVGCIGDISRAIGETFQSKLEIINLLIEYVHDRQFDRYGKISVFSVFGDFALSCAKKLSPYLTKIIKVFEMGISACIQLSKKNDQQDYTDSLKENILQSYLCVIHGVSADPVCKSELQSQIPFLIEFIKFTCHPQLNPTLDYVKTSLLILGDLMNFYKSKFGLIDKQLLEWLGGMLQKMPNKDEVNKDINYVLKIYEKI